MEQSWRDTYRRGLLCRGQAHLCQGQQGRDRQDRPYRGQARLCRGQQASPYRDPPVRDQWGSLARERPRHLTKRREREQEA
jgi:hypothetical protein